VTKKPKTCADCGKPVRGIGRRCPVCQVKHRKLKAARMRKFPEPVRDPDPNRNKKHLDWVASLPCAVDGCRAHNIVAAHVRMNTGGGTAMKPGDQWTVPLCWVHHSEQHQDGHRTFNEKYNLDLRTLAEWLFAISKRLGNFGDKPSIPDLEQL
jgi:hypothetical protein